MMIFRTREPHIVRVRKARRRPWKETRTYSRLNALSKTMGSAVRINFVKGIEKLKSKVDPEEVYRAWMSKNYDRVFELIPWASASKDLSPMTKSVQRLLERSSDVVVNSLPAPVKDNLRWDIKNPAVRDYVQNRTGELIVGIQADTRKVISNAVSRSFQEAMSPRRVASIIRPSIGLYPGQAVALDNYRSGLEKQGMKEPRVDQLSAKYEDRLLDYRAMMIARTEGSLARNQGQLSVWRAASDQGLIDKQTAQKIWITDGDPCDDCVDIEDQGPIDLDDFWDSDDGPIDAPPLHPHCFCGMELNFGESQEKMEENEPEEPEGDTDEEQD